MLAYIWVVISIWLIRDILQKKTGQLSEALFERIYLMNLINLPVYASEYRNSGVENPQPRQLAFNFSITWVWESTLAIPRDAVKNPNPAFAGFRVHILGGHDMRTSGYRFRNFHLFREASRKNKKVLYRAGWVCSRMIAVAPTLYNYIVNA